MTDKELLELAAKAAGGLVYVRELDSWIAEDDKGNRGAWWNPLTDDCDALRLAVKLEMRMAAHCNHEMICVSDIYGRCDVEVIDWGQDKYANMRRAITLVAAGIGESMP